MNEPISIQDFRLEEAKHDAEHHPEPLPRECKESCGNIARSTMRAWRDEYPSGHYHQLDNYPVLCREWLCDSTGEDNHDFTNDQIIKVARWKLSDSNSAHDSLTEFLTEWKMRDETLR